MNSMSGSPTLPFVLEPVSPERVQFWAQYAAQVSTQDGFDIVSSAYNAFWWENSAYASYSAVCERIQRSGLSSLLLRWLDSVVDEVSSAGEHWSRIVVLMERSQTRLEPWYQDARQRVAALFALRTEVVQYVLALCAAFGLSVPGYTQAVLTAQQGVAS